MAEYIVSARKYRPMTFDSVVGQKSLTQTLKNAVKSRRLAHAYLFCGPRGVGKTTCARIFAKAINCEHPTLEGEACGECPSCKAFQEQRSLNVFELDAASNNSVENIKQLMEQTRIPPQLGRYKVFIIDEVHMLSQAAFNAFLKTLEEPPKHVIFILATTEKHKILPTIISRCQIYDFERMSVPLIVEHLKSVALQEGYTCEEEALNVIAEKADGGMRDALSIFDQAASYSSGQITYEKVIEDLNVLDAENYFKVVDFALKNQVKEAIVLLNSVLEKGFEAGNFALGLAKHIRNVMLAKDATTISLLEVSQRQREKFQEQAKRCPDKFLYKALRILNNCDVNYKQSSAKRLLVELTLIEVTQITQEDDTASHGLCPKRLKSLFKNIVAMARKNTAPRVASAGREATKEASKEVGKQETTTESTSPLAANHADKAQNAGCAAKNNIAAPKISLKNIGFSFKSLSAKEQDKPLEDDNAKHEDKANAEPFTIEDVQKEWLMMCNRMPQQMTGLARRLKNLDPQLLEPTAVEVVVENNALLDEIERIKGRIRLTLAQRLRNDGLTFKVRMANKEEIKHILSPEEMLAKMVEENPEVAQLQRIFNLKIISS